METNNIFGLPYIYHMFNEYSAEEKWCNEDQKNELITGSDYWTIIDKVKDMSELM